MRVSQRVFYAVLPIVGAPLLAFGQSNTGDQSGGLSSSFTIGQSIEAVDGSASDDGVTAVTRLQYAFGSQTRNQSFSVSLQGGYQAGDNVDKALLDPRLRFSYERRNANSTLSFGGNYSRIDLDDDLVVIGVSDTEAETEQDFTLQEVVIEDGFRTDATLRAGFEAGLQAPLGFSLNTSTRRREFSNTTDPDLYDTRTDRLRAAMRFQINPTATAEVNAAITRYTAEDTVDTERDTDSYGVALRLQPNQTLNLAMNLNQRRVETRTTGGTTVSEGLGFGLRATQTMQRGKLSAGIDRSVTASGTRDSLDVARELSFSGGASLRLSLGVVENELDDINPLFGVNWKQPFKRGNLSVNLTQTAKLDENTLPVVQTNLRSRYNMSVSETSSLSFGVGLLDVAAQDATGESRQKIELSGNWRSEIDQSSNWSMGLAASRTDIEQSGGGDEVEERVTLRAGYRRELTRDWSLTSEISQTYVTNNTAADRTIQRVRVGVERTFKTR